MSARLSMPWLNTIQTAVARDFLMPRRVSASTPKSENEHTGARLGLPPSPAGWFAVCFAHDLPAGDELRTQWVGKQVRVSRDAVGRLRATTTTGDEIVLDEQQGAVLGWFHPRREAPTWRVPTPDAFGWTSYTGHVWRGLASHPQETSENSVDVRHFGTVHGYEKVTTLSEASADGPVLSARYAFSRPIIRNGPGVLTTRTEFRVDVHGLGFSFVETHLQKLGIRTRQLVMATPTDGERIDLRISAAVSGLDQLEIAAPLARLAVRQSLMRAFVSDVTDDFEIWQHKRYLERPALAKGDGPIPRYRKWARQFYVAQEQPS